MKVKVYKWLKWKDYKGGGTPYINTNIILTNNDEVSVEFYNPYFNDTKGGYGDGVVSLRPDVWNGFNIFNDVLHYGNRTTITGATYTKPYNIVEVKYPNLYLNGNVVITSDLGYISKSPMTILGDLNNNGNSNHGSSSLWAGRIIIKDKLHLVPCLTETNEACMLDLLSGELYRNQGSGAFSVEGECLYEFETPVIKQVMRKPNVVVRLREWLRISGKKCFVNIPINGDIDFKFKVLKYSDDTKLISFGKIYNDIWSHETLQRTSRAWEVWRDGGLYTIAPINEINEVHYGADDWTINGVSINVLNYPKGQLTSIDYGNANVGHGTGQFLLSDISGRYYPCDILYHPTLPPQSAMIDTNTGQIYTNQGSGQFTCEGADLGIWTDTLYDDMRIKDVKADMVCIMQDGEPRVVYERTQPFISLICRENPLNWQVAEG